MTKLERFDDWINCSHILSHWVWLLVSSSSLLSTLVSVWEMVTEDKDDDGS